jgi:FkbH-like protein
MAEARRYRKQKNKSQTEGNLKIAVIGSASIQYFVLVLDYLLHESGINADIYEGEYNGITMDVFDEDSALYQFDPQIVIILTHYTDIQLFPEILEEKDSIGKKAKDTVAYYQKVWEHLAKLKNVQVLQSDFAIPPEHSLGNLETVVPYSKTNFYRKINDLLVQCASDNVRIIDMDLLSSYVGKYQWFDYKAYFISKSGYNMEYVPDAASLFVKQIISMQGRTRKCLVLDLDNTLWGGVVGDEGYDGIQLDPNNALGEAYRYFQSYILELKKRGVILAVCSKNDEENAKEPFVKNPNMVLCLDDISCFMANWDDKVTNIKRIAETLNIGTDSLVFLDDNPAEREIVRKYLPEVYVVDVPPDPALYAIQLDKENPFNWLQFTEEDISRSKTYRENVKRQQMVSQFENYEEYLAALEMVGKAGEITEKESARFTQLLNKSNQFNLRTQRYTENQIHELVCEDNAKCLYVKLKDKFSEYGIISCVILRKKAEICFIESWVMSCRVLKRNVEDFMFLHIIEAAKEMNCDFIEGEYIRSKKNAMVSEFYDSLGFTCTERNGESKRYRYETSKPYKNKIFISEAER